jgi:hypothetical protein
MVYVDGCWSYCDVPVAIEQVCVIELPTTPVVAVEEATGLPVLEIPAGAAFKLELPELGEEASVAVVELRGLTLPVQILDWSPEAVALQLPAMGLTEAVASVLTIARPDGEVVRTIEFAMIPAAVTVASAE